MNIDCEVCQQWIKQHLAGELDDEPRLRMEVHLESCAGCVRERAALERTLLHLHELEDETPPRHFFVYKDHRRVAGIRRLLSPAAWGWGPTAAAGGAVVVVFLILIFGRTSLEWEQGRLTLSFGTAPDRVASSSQLSPESMDAVRYVIREENHKWADQVQRQLNEALSRAANEDRKAARELVAALGSRLEQHLQLQDDENRQLLQAALEQWGSVLARQRQEDLQRIQQVLKQFAANDRFQAGQSDAILATLVRIADSRNSRGGLR